MRLNATKATEQNIPLARMYQGDGFVLELAIENLVSEQERINAHKQNDEGSDRGQRTY